MAHRQSMLAARGFSCVRQGHKGGCVIVQVPLALAQQPLRMQAQLVATAISQAGLSRSSLLKEAKCPVSTMWKQEGYSCHTWSSNRAQVTCSTLHKSSTYLWDLKP